MPLIGTTIFPYSGTGLRRADEGLRFPPFVTAMADRSSYAPQERRPYNPCKIRKSHDPTDLLPAFVVTPMLSWCKANGRTTPTRFAAQTFENGFTTSTPSKSWPSFKSSDKTVSHPRSRAASMMAASQ